MIILENPTSKEVKVSRDEFVIDNEYIEIIPASLTIPPQSERGFEISYRPLIVNEEKEELVLNSPELGTYKYELFLKGLVSTAQRSLHFKCTLGAELMQSFKFKHYLKKATTYAVKCEDMSGHPSTCFKVEQPSIQAPAAENNNGVNLSANIRFEPNIIGESRAVLKLTSPENIEYTCLLYGNSTAPQPQGPFKIPAGKPVTIEFKNPLVEKAQFIATFDNPSFMLASKMPDFLEPGKPTQLQVTKAKVEGDVKHPPTGRMIVSTKGLAPWVYYLSSEEA